MDDEDVTELADLLRAHRGRARLTQKRLAAAVGVSEALIAHVETGKRSLGPDSAKRIASALKLAGPEREQFFNARESASEALATRRRASIENDDPEQPTNAELAEQIEKMREDILNAIRDFKPSGVDDRKARQLDEARGAAQEAATAPDRLELVESKPAKRPTRPRSRKG